MSQLWWKLLLIPSCVLGAKCFSCEGICHQRSAKCNCQTGLCDGPLCFTRRTHERGFNRISKGCANRLPTDTTGCFYDRSARQTLCYCDGDFCNSLVEEPLQLYLPNITCNECQGAFACDNYCSGGSHCRIHHNSRRTSCGYGYPQLPYMFRTRKTIKEPHSRAGMCVTLQEGKVPLKRDCTCGYQKCNDNRLLKQELFDPELPLYNCYSCSESSGTEISPATCKDVMCVGHFCTLSLATVASVRTGLRYDRTAGCLNTSHPEFVMRGCFQQWIAEKNEILQCACQGHLCNRSVGQALRDFASHSRSVGLLSLWSVFVNLFLPVLLDL